LNLPIMPQRLQEPCGGRKAVRGFASDTIAAFDAVTAEARECKIFVAVLGVELHLRGSPFQ
jgi:hypothetical protein